MIRVEYTIDDGEFNITVELLQGYPADIPNVVVKSAVHSEYGTYSFEDIFDGAYTLRFTDSEGCTYEAPVSTCVDCYPLYTPVGGVCIYYEEKAATYTSPSYLVIDATQNSSYGSYGTLLFDSWNYDGTGVYDRWVTPYWKNDWTTNGPLNRTSVWTLPIRIPQDIGFQFCINIAAEKVYYVGFACDNWGKIKLNGEYILEQDVDALTAMIVANGDSYDGNPDRIPFRYWYIYPLTLSVGQNIIEIFGHNETHLAACVGIQIYDATPYQLESATSDADLTGKILFDSIDLVDEPLMYEYSDADGFHGYSCGPGYALDTCGDTVKCIKRDVLDCGETTTTSTSSTTTTTSTTCYPYLYNWYALTNANDITSSDDWREPTYTDWLTMSDYLGGNAVSGGKLKTTGLTYWNTPNTGATNEVNFNAIGAGQRLGGTGQFTAKNELGYFLSITEYAPSPTNFMLSGAYILNDSVTNTITDYTAHRKTNGAQIRLLRDATAPEQLLDDGTYMENYTGNDGKVYPTVKIGTQVWLAKSLSEINYRDGSLIPNLTDDVEWSTDSTGALCAYDNIYSDACGGEPTTTTTTTTLAPQLGMLYNTFVLDGVGDSSITSSDDWIIPELTHFQQLGDYLGLGGDYGGRNSIGTLLKDSGTRNWDEGNTGTNSTGFKWVGSGRRATSPSQVFIGVKQIGGLLTTTSPFPGFRYAPGVQYNYEDLFLNSGSFANDGTSLRLIKDATGLLDGVTTTYTGNDSKTYNAIVIGEMYWLTENLEETQYRDNSYIHGYNASGYIPISHADWAALSIGALCLYEDVLAYAAKGAVLGTTTTTTTIP